MPNHEPRGCSRGASYSWYLYSASRVKYPMVRSRLVRAWREARKTMAPVEAWARSSAMPKCAKSYKAMRGRGGFVRSTWDEASEIIAAANVHTIKTWGPDRVVGFSPIPAMSMVSYASGARYLSLIGGTLLSFYDWYCDLPPSSPQTWGEQTDVPESADWYNSSYIIAWGSNVPQTRTPDAHFFVEARYNGTKVVAITPDYSEVAKLSDLWLHPKQGTDAAFAMAMGHVILREFFLDRTVPYFQDYCRRYTDMPMLVRLRRDGDRYVPDRYLRQSDLSGAPTSDRAAWKSVAIDEKTGSYAVPQGSMGYRWPGKNEAKGRWNLEAKDGETGEDVKLVLSVIDRRDDVLSVAFPVFRRHGRTSIFRKTIRATTYSCATCRSSGSRSRTARRSSPRCSIFSARTTVSTEGWAARVPKATTTTCPIHRLGRRRSPACRPREPSPSHVTSPTTRKRRKAVRW